MELFTVHITQLLGKQKMETKIFPVLGNLQFFDSAEPEQFVLMSSPDVTWTEKKI